MTWTKLSDDWTDETWTLTDQAHRMQVDLLVWSNRKLLDGRVPRADVWRACPQPPDVAEASLAELASGGWIELEDEFIVLRFHARYQRTREQQQAIQARNQANGQKGGRPPKHPREQRYDRVPTPAPPETQVGTQVETQVETQRDGTGRDGEAVDVSTSESGAYAREAEPITEWAVATIPGADPVSCTRCKVCDQELLHPSSRESCVCGIRDDAHEKARATV